MEATPLMTAWLPGPSAASTLQLPTTCTLHNVNHSLLWFRQKTPQETVIEGLLGRTNVPDMKIRQIEGKGRGVFVNERVPAGTFIAEYKTTKVYERAKRAEHENIYACGTFCVKV